MNAFLRVGLFAFVCTASLTQAEEKAVRVDASRDLCVAVVDSAKPSAARDKLYAAFAETLGDALGVKCGDHVGVRIKRVGADHAAFNLGTGVYDAVLVLGNSLPRPLMISEMTRLSATLGAGRNESKVFLLFGNNDARLAELLGSSFSVALTSDKFLNTFDGADLLIAQGGSKLAVAQ